MSVATRVAWRHHWKVRSRVLAASMGLLALATVAVSGWWWTRPLACPLPLRTSFDVGEPVTRVVFAPDGKTLAAAGRFGRVALWDVASRTKRADIAVAPRDPNLGFSYPQSEFSPDGRWIVVGSPLNFGTAAVYDTADGTKVAELPDSSELFALRFSPDGRTLMTAQWRPNRFFVVKRWDTATWREQDRWMLDAYGPMVFSADGSTLATTDKTRKEIRLWNLSSGRLQTTIRVPDPNPKSPNLSALAFSPDGRSLAASRGDGVVELWNLPARSLRTTFLSGPDGAGIFCIVFTPDGSALAGRRSVDHSPSGPLVNLPIVRGLVGPPAYPYLPSRTLVWDVPSGRARGLAVEPWSLTSFELAVSPDGKTLATIDSSRVKLWDLERRAPTQARSVPLIPR